MLMIDKHMPRFQFRQRHAVTVRGSAAHVHAAVAMTDTADDPVVAALLRIRQLPSRIISGKPWQRTGFRTDSFALLERDDLQSVYGAAGAFWKLDPMTTPIVDAAAFAAYDDPGKARLVIGFRAVPISGDRALLTTETRVHCSDLAALLPMACYWTAIGLGIGIIRQRFLLRIKREAERPPLH